MQIEEKNLRDYLLGKASPGHEEEISLRLISDEDFAALLEHAETDLLERYLDGELSPEEKALFLNNFLVDSRRRGLLHEVQMLRTEAGGRTSAKAAANSGASIRTKKPGFFAIFTRPAFVGAAAVFLVLVAGFAWLLYFRDSRTALEIEYAAINKRDLSDPARTSQLFTVNLIGNSNFRDSAGTAAYQYSAMSDPVLFRLALAVPETEGADMSVSVVRSGGSPFVVQNARVFRNAFGFELRFLAPKEALQPGRYEVVIESKNGRPANAPFHFRVE